MAAKIKSEADILCPPPKYISFLNDCSYISSDYHAISTMNLAKEAFVTSLLSDI